MKPIQGLHHITAVAKDPQANVDFYENVLGQRLVKTTVNFDDPGTYHLYYGDEIGTPGTIMTFFPWPMKHKGRRGNGETTAVAYAIPKGSVDYWACKVKPGRVMFEIDGVAEGIAMEALRLAAMKLPLKTRVVVREDW